MTNSNLVLYFSFNDKFVLCEENVANVLPLHRKCKAGIRIWSSGPYHAFIGIVCLNFDIQKERTLNAIQTIFVSFYFSVIYFLLLEINSLRKNDTIVQNK